MQDRLGGVLQGAAEPEEDGVQTDAGDITRLLWRAKQGDAVANAELLPLVYQELKSIAARQRRRQGRPDQLLNTTAVVHEAWLRLQRGGEYQNRHHFLAVAAMAMRQLLIDEARRQLMQKRGSGDAIQVTLDDNIAIHDQASWLVALDQALNQLGDYKQRLREVFQLRFFGGLTEEETAEILEISIPTVRRDWLKAKAMLAMVL